MNIPSSELGLLMVKPRFEVPLLTGAFGSDLVFDGIALTVEACALSFLLFVFFLPMLPY